MNDAGSNSQDEAAGPTLPGAVRTPMYGVCRYLDHQFTDAKHPDPYIRAWVPVYRCPLAERSAQASPDAAVSCGPDGNPVLPGLCTQARYVCACVPAVLTPKVRAARARAALLHRRTDELFLRADELILHSQSLIERAGVRE